MFILFSFKILEVGIESYVFLIYKKITYLNNSSTISKLNISTLLSYSVIKVLLKKYFFFIKINNI